jgi:signal transduction histidine kinase
MATEQIGETVNAGERDNAVEPIDAFRVLIFAPVGRDAALTRALLVGAGLSAAICRTIPEICAEIERGAGAVLLTEEALSDPQLGDLTAALVAQPPWSDISILLFAGADRSSVSLHTLSRLEVLRNVTLLDRPLRIAAVMSTVQAALRGRRRQYELRDVLVALHAARTEAERANRLKDEFLATLSHELRNPLAPISNSLHLLRLSNDAGPATLRIHEILDQQVNHMVRLVDDLLDISRITSGKIELRKEPVELAAIIAGAVETSRPHIEAAGLQLALSLPPEPITLEADPVRLGQVIANLLNNAAKYTAAGGQIWLTARQHACEAVLSVRDSGVGIPADMLHRVFDLFSQVNATIGRAQGGLGIGLTLAKSLVELHGGHIEAQSEGLGMGSTFVITLPTALHAPRPAVTTRALQNCSTPLPARRILVVDDMRDAGYVLGKLLEALGQQVHTLQHSRAALEHARRERPEVIISDIGMPDMDGYELARRMRREPGLQGVVLVALTGYGREGDRRLSPCKTSQHRSAAGAARLIACSEPDPFAVECCVQPAGR